MRENALQNFARLKNSDGRLQPSGASSITLFLLRKSPGFDGNFDAPGEMSGELKDRAADFSRIRCPQCRWQPNAASRWYCTDAGYPHFFYHGCGTSWNTFETRGRCPGCSHRWTWTDCLRCWQSSPHEAWYEKRNETAAD